MKWSWACSVAFAALLCCGQIASAELTAQQTKQAEAMIAQFSAREFAVRQAAVEKLVAMGPDVLPLIRKALAETQDAEVKMRCEMVIKSITETQRASRRLVEKPVKYLGRTPPSWSVRWSANGEVVTYLQKLGGKEFVVHNGKASRGYKKTRSFASSPDDGHLAFGVKEAGKCFVVRDGVEGPRYDSVGHPHFSPDSKSLAYAAQRGQRQFIVRDGRESQSYDRVSYPNFSRDSRDLVYTAARNGKEFIVIDDAEGSPHDIMRLSFGKKLGTIRASVVDRDQAWLLEVDWPAKGQEEDKVVERRISFLGKVPPEFPETASYSLSPGKEGILFVVKRGAKREVVFNSRRYGPFDKLGWGRWFSQDGKRLAFCAKRDGHWFVVVDGKEGASYDDIWNLLLSRDGKHVAYQARRGQATYVVYDSKPIKKQEQKGRFRSVWRLRFSPDSKHLAYVDERDGKEVFVCDSRESPEYEGLGFLQFSRDSKHLYYVVKRRGKSFMVCDGIEGPPHRRIRTLSSATELTGKLRYIVRDGGQDLLVEVDWPKDLDWTHGLEPLTRGKEN